ncbi:hypothetical protein [Amycolatopsis sp. NPDC004079]|uniref:hypothetical protein n=1 Tax=Amycolatopsis sp. NPDC004079 TaxID=3154549 RepID=UPI0033A7EFC4
MGKLTLRETGNGPALVMKVNITQDAVVRSVMSMCSSRRIGDPSKQQPLRYADVIRMIEYPIRAATYEGRHPILEQLDAETMDGDGPAIRLYLWVESELKRLGIFPPETMPGLPEAVRSHLAETVSPQA